MKLGKIAKQVLKTVAPTVAKAVGGPFGGLAMTVLQSVFPGEADKQIEQRLAEGSPETLLALKQAESDLAVRMKELGIREDELELENVQGARDLAKTTSVWFQFSLTLIAMIAFGTVLWVLVMNATIIPPENKDIVVILVGQLSGFVAAGYNFFVGSSKGSKEKSMQINQEHMSR